jgi:hypothetical protein
MFKVPGVPGLKSKVLGKVEVAVEEQGGHGFDWVGL